MKRLYASVSCFLVLLLMIQLAAPVFLTTVRAAEGNDTVKVSEVYNDGGNGFSFIELHNSTNEEKALKHVNLMYKALDQEEIKLELNGTDSLAPNSTMIIVLSAETNLETFNEHFHTSIKADQFAATESMTAFITNEQQIEVEDTESENRSIAVFDYQNITSGESIHFYDNTTQPTAVGTPDPGAVKEEAEAANAESGELNAAPEDSQTEKANESVTEEDTETKPDEESDKQTQSEEPTSGSNENSEEKADTDERQPVKNTAEEDPSAEAEEPETAQTAANPALEHEAITNASASEDLTIEAKITNGTVNQAKMLYKTAPTMEQQEIDMTETEAGVLQAIIPKEVLWAENFQYHIEIEGEGFSFSYPENEDFQTVKIARSYDPALQPPFLITEIVPDSDNVDGADGYEFIELYNNSNQSLNIGDYKLSYQYPDGSSVDWDLTADKELASEETIIVWIKNSKNQALTAADFNEHYGVSLADSQIVEINSDGMANGSERTIAFQTDSGVELVNAAYNADGADDTKANQGITYTFNNEATMKKVGLESKASPGSVIKGQVPAEVVVIEEDNTAPVIKHEPATEVNLPADINIKADIEEESFLQSVTLFYKQDKEAYRAVSMQQIGDSSTYEAEISAADLAEGKLEYYLEASDGFNLSKTEVYEMEVAKPEVDYSKLPTLLITEIVPDSTNVGSADGYEYIEVYNNTTASVNFQDYALAYVYPDTREVNWYPDQEAVIYPGEAVVFWIKNGQNEDSTAADFNANYGTDLVLGENLFTIHSAGMANGDQRTLRVVTKAGAAVSTAAYNDETGVDDTIANMGIFYQYPLDGSISMFKTSVGQQLGTPGAVTSDQVPAIPVEVIGDTTPPVLEDLTDVEEINQEEDLELTFNAEDEQGVKRVTVYYRTNDQEAFKQADITRNEQSGFYHYTVYTPEMIAKSYVEYYVVAADGSNETKTDIKRVAIQNDQKKGSPRLNVTDGQLLSDIYTIKAVSDTGKPEDTSLFIDGEEVKVSDSALESTAYFAFETTGINTYFQNGVVQNGEVLRIFDDWIDTYTTITVPIDPSTLQAGQNTISIHSGNKASPFQLDSEENRDDFDVKNVRLVLGDGTVIYDPAFADPEQVIDVGDNGTYRPVQDFVFTIEENALRAASYAWDTTETKDGDHTIKAQDQEGSDEVTVIIDNTAPDIETNAEEGKLYQGGFILDAEAEDALSGLEKMTVLLDDNEISVPFETSSAELEAGEHTLLIRAEDKAGNEAEREVAFSTPAENPEQPELIGPADEAAEVEGDPKLEVKVTDPTNDEMDVTFYQGYKYKVSEESEIKAYKNAVDFEPPALYAPEGEEAFTSEDIEKVADLDDQYLVNDSDTQFPYHRFEVPVSEEVDEKNVIELNWDGNSLPGRKVSMYAWNHDSEKWELVDYQVAGEEDFQLQGTVNVKEYVRDYKVNVLIQDEIAVEEEDYDYAFVWMSDTQYYSESYPYIYDAQTNWIAENKDKYNIDYVIHTGDIVNVSTEEYQWENADRSMKVLEDAGVPYGVLAGNHDVSQKDNDYTDYYRYFGEDRFAEEEYYGGSYKNNRGHYDLISSNGNDYIILYLGWGIEEEGIAWADAVLKAHPDRKAILNFHEYLLSTGNRHPNGDWLYEELVVDNENVFAVLSGHYHAADMLVDEMDDDGDGTPDRNVYQMLADYQAGPEGGQGYMRLMLFDTETNQIHMKTYSPYMDDYNYYNEDEYPGVDEFSLDLDMDVQKKRIATNYVEVNVFGTQEIGKAENVQSGETVSMQWEGTKAAHDYAWYVVAEDDNGGSIRSDMWIFTTAAAAGNEESPETGGEKPGSGTESPGDEEEPPGINPELPETGEQPDPDPEPEAPENSGQPGTDNVSAESGESNEQHKIVPALSGGNGNTDADISPNSGSKLPFTATSMYHWILAGACFILIGSALYVLYKRKSILK